MERCIELVNELIDELEKAGSEEAHIEIAEGLRDDLLEDYEEESESPEEDGEEVKKEEDVSDEELMQEAHKELKGQPHIKISISRVK